MAAKPLTLNIPEVLADELNSVSQDYLLELLERGLREVKIDRALDLYRRGGISLGAAAERAGVPASDLARSAYARGLQPPFSSEMLKELLLADSPRAEIPVPPRRNLRRVPGLHPAGMEADDDFDAPLPDEFWAGTE